MQYSCQPEENAENTMVWRWDLEKMEAKVANFVNNQTEGVNR